MAERNRGTGAAAPRRVTKRDGARVAFDGGKIASAIARAGAASGEFGADRASALADAVAQSLLPGEPGPPIHVEAIQDRVEAALLDADHRNTARAYIVYRERHARLRDDRRTIVDVAASVNEYLDREDWRVNANANQGYSLGGLILNVSGKVVANYWLSQVYAPEIGLAHREGDLHIHDLDMLAGYCAGWSLRQLLHEGLNGVPGKVEAGPPRHMSSAVGQIVNFLGTLQNEWAGAQAFSSFDTYMAPFIRQDRMAYGDVRQCIQELIYNLNVPSRWGTQTPFTNLTFDWTCPEDLRDQMPVIAGEEMPFTYGDLRAEMDMINRAYIEVMTAGDARGRVFTFPIPTYNITPDFAWDQPNTERAVHDDRQVRPAVLPEFHQLRAEAEHDPVDVLPAAARSHRAVEARQRSVRVRRANRIDRCRDPELRAPRLPAPRRRSRTPCAHRRAARTREGEPRGQAQGDPAPHRRRALSLHPSLPRHAAQSLLDHRGQRDQRDDPQLHRRRRTTSRRPSATRFALGLLDHIRSRILGFQEETGHMYNLEATPAEGTTYRFAKEDRKRYPDILQAGTRGDALLHEFVAASRWGSPTTRSRRWNARSRCRRNTRAAPCCTCTWASASRRPRHAGSSCAARSSGFALPYITVTPTFSICPTHGYLAGEHEFCPQLRRGAAGPQAARSRRSMSPKCRPEGDPASDGAL